MIVQNRATGGWADVSDELGADMIAGGRYKVYEKPKPSRHGRGQRKAVEESPVEPIGEE